MTNAAMTLANATRTFGLEVEMLSPIGSHELAQRLRDAGIDCWPENYNHITRDHWKLVTDSSIRTTYATRNFYPVELVSPPLSGNAGLEEVTIAMNIIEELGCTVNKSCGVHVHHHAADLNLNDFKALVYNYSKAELALDEVIPPSRRQDMNIYCQSIRNLLRFNEDKLENANSLNDIIQRFFNGDRYYKLNLTSYSKYSTVEFRHHSGSVEAAKITNWIVFTQLLVEYSKGRRARNGADLSMGTLLSWMKADKNFDQDTIKSLRKYYRNRKKELAS